jgi:hypothetical protein
MPTKDEIASSMPISPDRSSMSRANCNWTSSSVSNSIRPFAW